MPAIPPTSEGVARGDDVRGAHAKTSSGHSSTDVLEAWPHLVDRRVVVAGNVDGVVVVIQSFLSALTCAVSSRRDLLLQRGDLAVLESELPVDRARERGVSLCGQTRLLVHADESITESPARLPQ
jgi:hypothetical protein